MPKIINAASTLALVAAFAALTTTAQAQTAPAPGPITVVRSDVGIAPVIPAMFEPLTSGGLLDSLLVTGQPYAAVFDSETV